jgi:hypothetical protein
MSHSSSRQSNYTLVLVSFSLQNHIDRVWYDMCNDCKEHNSKTGLSKKQQLKNIFTQRVWHYISVLLHAFPFVFWNNTF